MVGNFRICFILLLILATRILISIFMGIEAEIFSKITTNENLIECQLKLKRIINDSSRKEAVDSKEKLPKESLLLAYRFPVHLLAEWKSSFLTSKGRDKLTIVLGIPTYKTRTKSHLRATLRNLIGNMNEEEQNETLIVVFIGETELDLVQQISRQIGKSFEKQLSTGLIDIVAPESSYYPEHIQTGKTLEKQNMDLAYQMSYAYSKGSYYVQLEDNIMTTPQFITTMKKFALIKSALSNPFQITWLVLDFGKGGFLGKLFKTTDLPYLITYLQLFYNDMSALDVLSYLITSKMCHSAQKIHCNKMVEKMWIHFKGNLFQNVGNITLKEKLEGVKSKVLN